MFTGEYDRVQERTKGRNWTHTKSFDLQNEVRYFLSESSGSLHCKEQLNLVLFHLSDFCWRASLSYYGINVVSDSFDHCQK